MSSLDKHYLVRATVKGEVWSIYPRTKRAALKIARAYRRANHKVALYAPRPRHSDARKAVKLPF